MGTILVTHRALSLQLPFQAAYAEAYAQTQGRLADLEEPIFRRASLSGFPPTAARNSRSFLPRDLLQPRSDVRPRRSRPFCGHVEVVTTALSAAELKTSDSKACAQNNGAGARRQIAAAGLCVFQGNFKE